MITERDEIITPQLAKEYLDLNEANWRRLNRSAVTMLAEDMAEGRWVEGTGSIDFTEDGRLGDGQHRLAAVVESGVSIRFRVRRGVPQAVVENTDTGRKRNLSDLLTHRGESNTSQLAAMLNLHYRWAQGVGTGGGFRNPTQPMLLDWLKGHPTMRDYARHGSSLRRAIAMKTVVGATAIYEFSRIDPDEAQAFHDALVSGTGLAEGDPVLSLRRQMTKVGAGRYTTDRFDDLALTIKAWNAWLLGQPTKLLVYRRGGARPEPFPQPVDAEGKPWEVR